MKKLLSILFILSSPAFAIDKPIPCDGANCKLKFETRDGSNVKVSAGNVDGTGAWTVGPSSATTLQTINGRARFPQRGVELSGTNSGGTYINVWAKTINPATTQSCSAACLADGSANSATAASGSCMLAWSGGSTNPSTCGSTTNEVKHCICAGVN